jgi:hypothetical protein
VTRGRFAAGADGDATGEQVSSRLRIIKKKKKKKKRLWER